MRIVYLILAHKSPNQVARLVRTLTYPGVECFVHVDGRRDLRPFVEALPPRDYPSLHFIQHRARVYMTGYPRGTSYSQVEAVLWSLAEVVSRAPQFDHVVLLSGQDYPIKRNDEIHAFFDRHRGKEFLEQFPVPANPDRAHLELRERLRRIGWYHFEGVLRGGYIKGLNRAANWILPARRFPQGFTPYWGSVYWRFTYPCAKYVVDMAREHPEFIRFFRFVNCPDEYVFHTLVLNSEFADRVVNDNLTYMDWPGTYHPKTLTVAHFDDLAGSPKLLARKFDVNADAQILDLIDSKLLGCAKAAFQTGTNGK